MVLLNGHLKKGYHLWQKEEQLRKGFNIAWIQTLPTTSCTSEQFKDIQEKTLLILRCKTMYYYRKDLLSASSTSGNASELNSIIRNGLIQHTTCFLHWVKTQNELHQKFRLTPRVPRVVLKSNSQHGQQDPRSQDARSSWEPSSDSKSYGEICSNIADYRVSGVPLSAVKQQNTTRENQVKKLIEKFENRQHKESFLEDLSQTQKINKFRKESQYLIADLNNTEIFELCENSSKQECLDCNLHWEAGIVHNSCGRCLRICMQYLLENRYHLLQLWKKYEIFAEQSRCQTRTFWKTNMYYHARQMLKKARQEKHGRHPTVLSRCRMKNSESHCQP